jgi:HEAT repeat protein
MTGSRRWFTPLTLTAGIGLVIAALVLVPDPPSADSLPGSPRYREVVALGRERDPANLPALLDAAADPDPRVREAAIVWVGRLCGKAEVPFLIRVLRSDDSPAVRAAAAQALGRFRLPEVGDALIQALHDAYVVVRARAGGSMSRLLGVDVHYRAADPVEKRQAAIRKFRFLWGEFKECRT